MKSVETPSGCEISKPINERVNPALEIAATALFAVQEEVRWPQYNLELADSRIEWKSESGTESSAIRRSNELLSQAITTEFEPCETLLDSFTTLLASDFIGSMRSRDIGRTKTVAHHGAETADLYAQNKLVEEFIAQELDPAFLEPERTSKNLETGEPGNRDIHINFWDDKIREGHRNRILAKIPIIIGGSIEGTLLYCKRTSFAISFEHIEESLRKEAEKLIRMREDNVKNEESASDNQTESKMTESEIRKKLLSIAEAASGKNKDSMDLAEFEDFTQAIENAIIDCRDGLGSTDIAPYATTYYVRLIAGKPERALSQEEKTESDMLSKLHPEAQEAALSYLKIIRNRFDHDEF